MPSIRPRWFLSLTMAVVSLGGCTHPTARTPAPPGPGGTTGHATAALPAAVDVADAESDATTLASKVRRVTVYSDRARITRLASADVTATPTVFAFRHLPGWVDDGSVQVAAGSARIVDVRVDRRFLAQATDPAWRKVEDEQRRLTAEVAALEDELAIRDAEKAQIEAMKGFSTAKLNQDTVIGAIDVKSYGDVLAFVTGALRTSQAGRRATQAKLDALQPELAASARRVEDARSLMQLEETTVLVTLQATTPAPVAVELTYMLPGVTWEPMHELRASTTDDKTVEVISFAAVTQTSGEDWGGAELAFSTQSTTQSVRIPELEALTLGDTTTATRILTSQVSSFTRAESAFNSQSQLWNKFHQDASAERARSNFEQVYQANIEYLQAVQGRTVSLFESLEKRGTTGHFRAEHATSVRGDGHPVKLLIGRSVLGSTQQIVAAPEQSLNAARTVAMTNSTDQPLLPGKVALYQDGAFLGMTDMDFIAKGERFSLFLSVADQVKLTRQLDRKQSTLVRKTRNSMQVVFIVTAENLSNEETSFTLADRIPVSENKDIKVDRVSIAPSVRPDSQGLLHWDLTLKPGEKREFRIAYQVEYPAELVIETNRRRMMEADQPAPPAGMSPSPSRATKTRIEDEIMDLENQF